MNTRTQTADDADDRFEQEQEKLRAQFLPKLRRVLAHVPFADELLACYYAMLDRQTPSKVRLMLAGALTYFVLPVDVIPDFIVGLGYTDDAAVLLGALRLVSGSIRPHHREAARRWLDEARNR